MIRSAAAIEIVNTLLKLFSNLNIERYPIEIIKNMVIGKLKFSFNLVRDIVNNKQFTRINISLLNILNELKHSFL